MSLPIADYALIGNLSTVALVGSNGSIDWFCAPRFDSPACFAALLGSPENGRWLIAPEGELKTVRRSYRGDSLVLETIFETADGVVALIDFMPTGEQIGQSSAIIRLVEGLEGSVRMLVELVLAFDYGEINPRSQEINDGWLAIAGPDAVLLRTNVKASHDEKKILAQFTVTRGQTIPFTLTRYDSNVSSPRKQDSGLQLERSEAWWNKWTSKCTYNGPHRSQILRSLITLKGLICDSTGAITAAPTTSLPEQLGGSLNWDYRFCWIRDATFALCALLVSGYTEEVIAWRRWLMRAVAGQAHKLQTVYGLSGERRLKEIELTHLQGYEGSKPVRIGNAAYKQFQIDVYGQMLGALYIAHSYQIKIDDDEWQKLGVFLEYLETAWKKPDDGIWQVRGRPRHFTESKAQAWVAFDRAIRLIENHGFQGPLEKWRAIREEIHADVCEHGFDSTRNSFVQYYGSSEIDAALLRLPLVGFLPASDSRIVGTVDAIQRELAVGGLVQRQSKMGVNTEGAFLPCSFWLVDCLVAMDRGEEARTIYDRLLGLCNDVGLLSEEYDPVESRMLGNFPQALTEKQQ
jgi:GH15 family glucan-1,4-alpha-glucosidase